VYLSNSYIISINHKHKFSREGVDLLPTNPIIEKKPSQGHKRKAVNVLDKVLSNDQTENSVHTLVHSRVPNTSISYRKSFESNVRPEGIEPSTH